MTSSKWKILGLCVVFACAALVVANPLVPTSLDDDNSIHVEFDEPDDNDDWFTGREGRTLFDANKFNLSAILMSRPNGTALTFIPPITILGAFLKSLGFPQLMIG